MEKREGPAAQTDQNFEELAGSMQGCKLAGARSGGGEPHSKTASTSKLTWDWATTTTSSSSQMTVNSDSAALTGQMAWGDVVSQEATGASSDLIHWGGGLGRCRLTRGNGSII